VLFGDGLNDCNAGFPEGPLSRVVTSTDYGVPQGFVPPRREMLGAKLIF
jgi:hypothetical protein